MSEKVGHLQVRNDCLKNKLEILGHAVSFLFYSHRILLETKVYKVKIKLSAIML